MFVFFIFSMFDKIFQSMKKILSPILMLTMASRLLSQAPQGINYQAALRNGSGQALANTALTLRLGIYSGAGATLKVYEETQSLTSNNTGVVNCVIGKGSVTSGNFTTINWGSDQFHLKAEANTGGGFLDLGTQQLISVPYAMYSNQAGGISGTISPAQIGGGGAATDQVLSWNGSSWAPKNAAVGTITEVTTGTGLTGGGTSGTITLSARNTDPLWNANQLQGVNIRSGVVPFVGGILRAGTNGWEPSAETVRAMGTGLSLGSGGTINSVWTQNGSDIYNNNTGRVGIGTSKPTFPLHVSGSNATVAHQYQGKGWDAFYYKGTELGYLGVFNDTNDLDFGTNGTGRNVNIVTGSGSTPRLTVTSSGKLGAGITNPNFKLHLHEPSTTSAPVLQFSNQTSGNSLIDGFVIGFNTISAEALIWNFENQNLLFGTNSTERMRISSGGSVGIGKNNPGYLLDIGTSLSNVRVLNAISAINSTTDGAGRFSNVTGIIASLGTSNNGIYASTASSTNTSGAAVYGDNGASNTVSYAGFFNGRTAVNGSLSVLGALSKSSGTFKIDHPLDPENKYLYHSFVESPDMMNIYNGIAVADEHGEALVLMPEWFEALNMEFRYQLTCVGGYAPVYIAEKLQDNKFKIAGATKGLEISWQVTGIRHDAYAEKNRIQVEVEKSETEKGTYLHPEVFGKPADKGIYYRMQQQNSLPKTTEPAAASGSAAQEIPGTTAFKPKR